MDNQETNNETEKELRARFELLPDDIKNVISSSDYQMKLFEIAKKNKLTYEQLGGLELQTTLALLGLSDPNEYISSVAEQLGKKPDEVKGIVEEVKQEVFSPIRASLMSLYERSSEPSVENDTQAENKIFAQSGISLQSDTPKTTPPAGITENRSDILAGIENPIRLVPKPLETKAAPVSAMPISKGEAIPVPRAPYAGTTAAPTVQQPVPMTAKPAGDMLASKLSGNFAMPAKETDHSLKPSAVPPASKGGDSYREPIE